MISREEMLALLACPTCKAVLSSFSECRACGAQFSDSTGTPALFPTSVEREVSFKFRPSRSTKGAAFQQCFKSPPVRGAAGKGYPYHLDAAHMAILDQLPKGSQVLEIGCGGGQMREFLGARGLRYIGVDISKSRVHEFLQRYGGPDLLCDAHFLPFGERSFDAVYSVAVTEHLACPLLAAQDAARCLKPGGYYLGNVSFLEPWHDDSFFHMSPLGVFELLAQAQFDVLNIWPGEGYSGFRAMLSMGNKATKAIAPLGAFAHHVYNAHNKLRDFVRGTGAANTAIVDAATVAGAIDWIARRPIGV